MLAEELLQELVSAGEIIQEDELKEILRKFLVTYSNCSDWSAQSSCSRLYPLASVLAEKLLAQYSNTFVSHRSASLTAFLSQELNLYYLLSLGVVSQHADLHLIEVANLLIVVIRKLLQGIKDQPHQLGTYNPVFTNILKKELEKVHSKLDVLEHLNKQPNQQNKESFQSNKSPRLSDVQNKSPLLVPEPLNCHNDSKMLKDIICTVLEQEGSPKLTTLDHCLLMLLVYQNLTIYSSAVIGSDPEAFMSGQVDCLCELLDEAFCSWVYCYATLERDSHESLRLLVTASDEEPSGTESDRERKVQMFAGSSSSSILSNGLHICDFICGLLHSWRCVTLSWMEACPKVETTRSLFNLLHSVMQCWTSLKERYISVMTQIHFSSVFLEILEAWLSVVLPLVSLKTHPCDLCISLVLQGLNGDIRNELISSITKVCAFDQSSSKMMEKWLPKDLGGLSRLISRELEGLALLLSHTSSHMRHWLGRSSSIVLSSPSERKRQLQEVAELKAVIGEMAKTLFEICQTKPDIQIGILQLLLETVTDPMSVFKASLSSPHSFLHADLASLERYISLIKKVLLQVGEDQLEKEDWAAIFQGFGRLLLSIENLEMTELLLTFFKELCPLLKLPSQLALTEHCLLAYFRESASHQRSVLPVLKVLEVVLRKEECMQLFLRDKVSLHQLISLVPQPELLYQILRIFKMIITSSHSGMECVNFLSRAALNFRKEDLDRLCQPVSSRQTSSGRGHGGWRPTGSLGMLQFEEVDQFYHNFEQILGDEENPNIISPPDLFSNLPVVACVWSLLVEVAQGDSRVEDHLASCHMTEAIKLFSPAVVRLLVELKRCGDATASNRALEILCYQVQMHILLNRKVELREKVLLHLLDQLHNQLRGCHLMELESGREYCSVLFECALFTSCFTQKLLSPPNKETLPVKQTWLRRKRSPTGSVDSSEMSSGYEADQEDNPALSDPAVARLPGRSLQCPPIGVDPLIVLTAPLLQATELVVECLQSGCHGNSLSTCEVYIMYLYHLLKSNHGNRKLVYEEGIVNVLLKGFGDVYGRESLAALRCCYMLECVVAEVSEYCVDPVSVKTLFKLCQSKDCHLERLPQLLLNMAQPYTTEDVFPWKPVSYISFDYPEVKIDPLQMTVGIPLKSTYLPRDIEAFFISTWISVKKHTYPVMVHLLSVPLGRAFLEIWADCRTGDIIIKMSSDLTWSLPSEVHLPHSSKPDLGTTVYGTILNLGVWNHLLVAFQRKHQSDSKGVYQVTLSIDGQYFDPRQLEFNIPVWVTLSESDVVLQFGGGCDTNKSMRTLLQSRKEGVSWSMASFVFMLGIPVDNASKSLFKAGPGDLEVLSTVVPPPQQPLPQLQPLVEEERRPLTEETNLPYVMYSAQHPNEVHLLIEKSLSQFNILRETVCEQIRPLPSVVSTHCLPHLLDVIHSSIGIDGLIYLLAKAVELQFSGCGVGAVLRVIEYATRCSGCVHKEFTKTHGTHLIALALRSSHARVDRDLVEAVLDWSFGSKRLTVENTNVLQEIVLDWRIWQRDETIWRHVLKSIEKLMSPENSFHKENWSMLVRADVLKRVLMIEKERSQDNSPPLSANIVTSIVQLISCLIGSPPKEACLKEVWSHVLVPQVNLLKFLAERKRYSSSFTILESSHGMSSPEVLSPDRCSSTDYEIIDNVQTTEDDFVDECEDVSEEKAYHLLLVKMKEQQFNPLGFFQVTGVLQSSEVEIESGCDLEVGLLGEIRRQIINLPDKYVSSILGPVISYNGLMVMANHDSITIRTATIRVMDEYFKRVDKGVLADFVQMRGFDLLASQLKGYSVSFEQFSALFSITFGRPFHLKLHKKCSVAMPSSLTKFQIASLIPILMCLLNSVSQPPVCQSVLSLLQEMYGSIETIPAFFVEQDGLQILVWLVVKICYTKLDKDDRSMLLTEVLQFMCSIIEHSFNTQEDTSTLRQVTTLLRRCEQDLSEGSSLVAKVPRLFQILIQRHALQQLVSGMSGSGTLSSKALMQGKRDTLMCEALEISVRLLSFGTLQPFSDKDVNFFNDVVDLTQPLINFLSNKITRERISLSFIRYLLRYMHSALHRIIRKVTGFDGNSQFSQDIKDTLNQNYATLLCVLLSKVQPVRLHQEVLRLVWSLQGHEEVFKCLIETFPKRKHLHARLSLAVMHLAAHNRGERRDDSLQAVLNEIFNFINTNKDISSLRLGKDLTRVDQKQMAVVEEGDLKCARDLEFQKSEWEEELNRFYNRICTQSKSRGQVVDASYTNVTERLLEQQSTIRRGIFEDFLERFKREKESFQIWRQIILLNTSQRGLWSSDERREMWIQLDPTEGPSRERRRLMRVPKTIDQKYLVNGTSSAASATSQDPPLHYLFEHVTNVVREAPEGHKQDGVDPHRVEQPCIAIWPDKSSEGTFVITETCFAFYCIEAIGDPNMTKFLPSDTEATTQVWAHSEVTEVHRCRYLLKDTALEFYLNNGKTIFLSFTEQAIRNKIHSAILKVSLPNLMDGGETDSTKLKTIVASWVQGEMSNFEYLMELNKLAGRTFTDLMQYPVFPYALANYSTDTLDLSDSQSFRKFQLPIAIQNESNIERYQKHYMDMLDLGMEVATAHHYSSLYSNSSTVLHYLVRMPPFTQMFLDFQGGNFDIPDRTFHSISTAWELSSFRSLSDVKELIPEFFYFPEFLTNIHELDFGTRQGGEEVDNVILPPWAKGDARLFILKHREALESRYVSEHLHEWIDLVFGYKQKGKAALDAINVFHPSTYVGNAEGREVDQGRLMGEVKMYGQVPVQLFRDPHPARHHMTVLKGFKLKLGSLLRKIQEQERPFVHLHNDLVQRHLLICRPRQSQPGQDFIGSSRKTDLVCVYHEDTDFDHTSLCYLGNGDEKLALSKPYSMFFLATSSSTHQNFVATWRNWDNAVHILAFSGSIVKLHLPLTEEVTHVEGASNGQLVVAGTSAGLLYCWRLGNTPQQIRYTGQVVYLRGHTGPITCLTVCRPYSVMISGSKDHTAIIWDTNRQSFVACLADHEGPVTCVASSPTMGDVATACNTETGSTLRIWTVNGRLIKKATITIRITSLLYTGAPEGTFVNVVIGGLVNGNIRMWSSWDLTVIRDILTILENPIPVTSLGVSNNNKELFAIYQNKEITIWIKPE